MCGLELTCWCVARSHKLQTEVQHAELIHFFQAIDVFEKWCIFVQEQRFVIVAQPLQ